ncbi:ABC transporter ATP-binding protein [Streptomyces griseorubiginosus]|uniref:ABC transporter ATP-binding protein n=1 Tax=Streptomyces griseorubiginosus TaxID=67304 RepID=UPI003681D1DE
MSPEPAAAPPLLQVRDLRLDVTTDDGHRRPILRGIDLSVRAGEALGIVGESGSGKSMTLRCIARLTPPGAHVSGDVLVGGRDVSRLRGKELRRFRQTDVGYVFQDPRAAINPMHTVGDFLLEVARDRGEDEGAARADAVEILTRMGIADPEQRMRQYPFELSGGLLQRVMIASVLMAQPALLLADEPTTALDVTTQSDVLALTDRLRRERGIAMLFVTHDLDLAMAVCKRIAVVYAGQLLEVSDADSLRHRPLHPYTRGLLTSRPPLQTRLQRIPVIPGTPISAADVGPGCPFAGRCPVVLPRCNQEPPPRHVHPGGVVHCHRAEEIAAEHPAHQAGTPLGGKQA